MIRSLVLNAGPAEGVGDLRRGGLVSMHPGC